MKNNKNKSLNKFFQNKKILVTGGTGSFGKAFVERVLNYKVKKIIILSRDELKQFEMRNSFKDNRLEFYIGDVRDASSIIHAFNSIDCVFHAAALKQVPSSEFFPTEAMKTNTIGTENVIECCLKKKVKNFVLLSTDKAVYPINAMGYSKALAEKIVIAKSRVIPSNILKLTITRYGNVIGSRGSVIPHFITQAKNNKPITITDDRMTRFFMTLDDALDLISFAFVKGEHGSIYVKNCDVVRIIDVAKVIKDKLKSKSKIVNIGLRHGEKIYETLISENEMIRVKKHEDFYQIPQNTNSLNYEIYFTKGRKQKKYLNYSSNTEAPISTKKIAIVLSKIKNLF